MKKIIAMLLLIGMSMAVLTGCGENEETSETNSKEYVLLYVEYEIGDVIYDDGSMSFAITALTENENDGYSMTVLATDNNDMYDFIFTLEPYDTEEFDKYANGETSTISPASSGVTFYIDRDEEDPEVSGEFDWDAKYVYYDVSIFMTSEKVTDSNIQEIFDSDETEAILDTRIKIDTSGVTMAPEESTTDSEEKADSESEYENNEEPGIVESENNTEAITAEPEDNTETGGTENKVGSEVMDRFMDLWTSKPTISESELAGVTTYYIETQDNSSFYILYTQADNGTNLIEMAPSHLDESVGASDWLVVGANLMRAVDESITSGFEGMSLFSQIMDEGSMTRNGIEYTFESETNYFTIAF